MCAWSVIRGRNPDEIEVVNSRAVFVIGNQCRCPAHIGVSLLLHHQTFVIGSLPHFSGRQPSLPIPWSFRASTFENGPSGQDLSRTACRTGASMEEKKGLLTDLLQKDDDPVRIEELRKEMAAIQDEIQKEVIVHIIETKKILDPGQQQKFFDLMRQSMSRTKGSWSTTNGGK